MKECTFAPKVNHDFNNNNRNIGDFLGDQEKFLKQVEEKKKIM